MSRKIKETLSYIVSLFLRATSVPRRGWRQLYSHARLSSMLRVRLNESVVILGKSNVYGTGNIRFGRNVLLYPSVHLETQLQGAIEIGDNVVLSSGVHLVSAARITIGNGSMVGEYTSIRDANHARRPGVDIRHAGHSARPIALGAEVWIGRGVTVLEGVSIGDGATVGANAVVTRDVPAGATVAGVPARLVIASTMPAIQPEDEAGINREKSPAMISPSAPPNLTLQFDPDVN